MNKVFSNFREQVRSRQVPYTLRAMLRIITNVNRLVQKRQQESFDDFRVYYSKFDGEQLYVGSDTVQLDAPIITRLLVGCWLSAGFRDPTITQAIPPLPGEAGYFIEFFQSSCVLFECLMS